MGSYEDAYALWGGEFPYLVPPEPGDARKGGGWNSGPSGRTLYIVPESPDETEPDADGV